MVANATDGLFVVLLLAAGLAIATAVGQSRGGHGWTMILTQLSWPHLVTAAFVVAALRLGAGRPTARTPGQALVARLSGSSSGGMSVVSAVAPALAVVTVAAVLVGWSASVDDPTAPPSGTGATASTETDSARTIPPADPRPPAPESGDPWAQAYAVDAILRESAGSRALLRDALTVLDQCPGSAGASAAVDDLRDVTDQRRTQLDEAERLVTDGLPAGDQIRDTLVAALTYSVEADQAFVAWGERVASGGCGHDANHQAGLDASALAQAAKDQFCDVWNAVAPDFGLPRRTRAEI